jgi:hypothetical protein
MAMYSFVPPFREATFCGVPSCVFDKLGCATGEKSLRNTGLGSSKKFTSGIKGVNIYICTFSATYLFTILVCYDQVSETK